MTELPENLSAQSIWIDAVEERSNLTRSQFLMWMGQSLNPDSPHYNMAFAYRIRTALDVTRFRTAFSAEIDSNDALRTVVKLVDGVLTQSVVEYADIKDLADEVEYHSIEEFGDNTEAAVALQSWLQRRARKKFEFGDLMWDAVLIELDEKEFIWFFNQHHLITDAWSSVRVFDRVMRGYTDRDYRLPAQESFSSYAREERLGRNSDRPRKVEDFWRQQISAETDDPVFYGESVAAPGTAAFRQELVIDSAQAEILQGIAASSGMLSRDLGLFAVFAALLCSFVSLTSNARRIAIGVPLHNRLDKAAKNTPGLFVEVLPLIVEVREEDSFKDLLKQIQINTVQLLRNAAAGVASPEAARRCQVFLNFVNYQQEKFQDVSVKTEWIDSAAIDENHRLRLQIHNYDGDSEFRLLFDFNCAAFSSARRDLAMEHFQRILDAFAHDVESKVSRVDLLTKSEWFRLAEATSPAAAASYTAPRNDLEERIAEIWRQVLSRAEIGVFDNFFEVGGHSLNLFEAMSRLSELFAIELPIRTLFDTPTIAEVAVTVEKLLIEQIENMSDAEVAQELQEQLDD
jgi:acyl carrier protein